MISTSSYIVAAKDLLSSRLGEEIVILSVNGGKYYGLNPLAAFVWSRLSEPVRFDSLLAFVMEEYDVAEDRCIQDLSKLLEDLKSEGLVDVMESITKAS